VYLGGKVRLERGSFQEWYSGQTVKTNRKFYLAILAIFAFTAVFLWWMGRLWLGPDGRFGLYSADIWSAEQSQRVFDPYSFSHFIHGILFFALLWPLRSRIPLRIRFLLALGLEAGWEMLENSPIIINRYRAVTIALGYEGDSILNSLSDIVLAGIGFWFAYKTPLKICLAVIVVCEIFTLWWVRDNLTLNVIMLVWPLDVIREWQSAVAPAPI
jgi:hypothetical protein